MYKKVVFLISTLIVTSLLIIGGTRLYYSSKNATTKPSSSPQSQPVTGKQLPVTSITPEAVFIPKTSVVATVAPVPPNKTGWRTYHSDKLGISLSFPDAYVPEPVAEEHIKFSGASIAAQEVYMRKGQGETPQINLIRTQDAQILQYLAIDHPLRNVSINGSSWQKFEWDGMGDTVGYVSKQGMWFYVLSFDFPPEEIIMGRILQSVKFR